MSVHVHPTPDVGIRFARINPLNQRAKPAPVRGLLAGHGLAEVLGELVP